MFRLPPQDHKVRDFFSVEHLAEMLAPERRRFLPTLRAAIEAARRNGRTQHTVVACADGSIRLIRCGPHGGHLAMWTFGRA